MASVINNIDLHIFITKNANSPIPSWVKPFLRKEEVIRSERFAAESDRFIYITSHAFLNSILCRETGKPPDLLPFEVSKSGKPFLYDTSLFFSLSHSKNGWVVAISRHNPIGADIEEIKSNINLDGILENYFTINEQFSINSSGNPMSEFYRIWTRKEAVLKAMGTGLNYKLNELETCSDTLKINLPSEIFFIKSFYLKDQWISVASSFPFTTTLIEISNQGFLCPVQ